ncbi:MAG: flagellar assembly peptidoglycan hydrolase FlgJ [Gammaproteobacteria bacterium]|nr:flagellar assembly peptidoglycan hydrolase FlgJ [Gammaproteobacteria bacterium]
MTAPVQSADVYTDFQGLTRLRAEAHTNSPETLRAVAQQFEALFTQMMLKSMREASLGDDLFDGGSETKQYRDMFDQQLALTMSKGRGIGLADMLVHQLSGGLGAPQASGDNAPNPFASRLFRGEATPLNQAPSSSDRRNPHTVTPATTAAPATGQETLSFDGPDDFVQKLWPHAEQAARELGVTPQFLLAQAALETGWGQSIIHSPRGSSNNLFGIKADASWDGPRTIVSTLEYVHDVAVKRNDAFRTYASPAASFADYVNFLRENPRYGEALQQTGNPEAFARALQDAGYATDPRYADKITAIMNSDTLRNATADLRISSAQPLAMSQGKP